MNRENIKQAYSEVYKILELMDEKYINKLPKKLLDTIRNNMDKDYIVHIDPNMPLEEQGLLENTTNMLAMMKLDYWCETEQEKNELIAIISENEIEYNKKISEKYNVDNLFKKEDNKKYENKTTSLTTIQKKSLIKKIFDMIKSMFKK